MLTLGSATSGYCATGSTRIDAIPARITAIVITQANTGRLAKNLASMSVLLRGGLAVRRLGLGGLGLGRLGLGRLGLAGLGLAWLDLGRMHRHARADLVEPLDDQTIAGGQPAGHQPAIADRALRDQRARLDLVAGADDERARVALGVMGDALLRRE